MRYLLAVESVEDLLSLPSDEPLLMEAPKSLTLDGGGKELAELSLNVDAESLSPADRNLGEGFLSDELDPPLSDKRPYSPNFRGGGINERAGLALLLLALELNESPPSDFLRGLTSVSGRRLYSPRRLGRPLLCEDRGGLGRELGGKLSGHRPDGLSEGRRCVVSAKYGPAFPGAAFRRIHFWKAAGGTRLRPSRTARRNLNSHPPVMAWVFFLFSAQ